MNSQLAEKAITDTGWCEPPRIPIAFVRRDDGQRMSINPNGMYSWDNQKADPEHLIYEYSLYTMTALVGQGYFTAEYA